jgi:L-ribulokinase
MPYALGLDYGTQSVRALLVDVTNGTVAGEAEAVYPHGVIDRTLPGSDAPLEPDAAHQHPADWLSCAATVCHEAVQQAGIAPAEVVGIGVAFTSCTMMPALHDGTPLCLVDGFTDDPQAWPKLWKHHAAKRETDHINALARQRGERWLDRYGGTIGLEWFWPKVLEAARKSPAAYAATQVWLEGGDWLTWQLIDGPFPACHAENLVRSTCQAGYKACWSRTDGYCSPGFLAAADARLAEIDQKMPGTIAAPGTRAGGLSSTAAQLLGLVADTPVSVGTIDAHAGVPGAGVGEAGTLVLVMGTSSCHMLNGETALTVPGVAGVVQDGILPALVGYETGQSSVGDAFAWLADLVQLSHRELNERAVKLPPGANGVLALDWLNGCRTPLMDGNLSGLFVGITLGTTPEQLYRALLEATAFGVRWIVETLERGGVPVNKFVASGGLPTKSPLLMQIYADVLGKPIHLAESRQPVALGAAILGAAAAGVAEIGTLVHRMAHLRTDLRYTPDIAWHEQYGKLYHLYRNLAAPTGTLAQTMRTLRTF